MAKTAKEINTYWLLGSMVTITGMSLTTAAVTLATPTLHAKKTAVAANLTSLVLAFVLVVVWSKRCLKNL